MTWSKFDDGYDEHDKIEEAWERERATVGLHVMATTHCNRNLTDGVIKPKWLTGIIEKKRERDRVLAVMLEFELFDLLPAGTSRVVQDEDENDITLGPFLEDRYVVHDFLDRHESSVMIKARRADARERKRKSRNKASSENGHTPVTRDDAVTPPVVTRDDHGTSRGGHSPHVRARVGAQAPPDPTRPDQDSSSGSPAVGGHARTTPLDPLEETAVYIVGVLQRGVDGLTGDEPAKTPTKTAVLKVLRKHQAPRDVALAAAVETRSIAASQNRAPNIVGLYDQKLGQQLADLPGAAAA